MPASPSPSRARRPRPPTLATSPTATVPFHGARPGRHHDAVAASRVHTVARRRGGRPRRTRGAAAYAHRPGALPDARRHPTRPGHRRAADRFWCSRPRRRAGQSVHHGRRRRVVVRRTLRPGRQEAGRADRDADVPGRSPRPGPHPRRPQPAGLRRESGHRRPRRTRYREIPARRVRGAVAGRRVPVTAAPVRHAPQSARIQGRYGQPRQDRQCPDEPAGLDRVGRPAAVDRRRQLPGDPEDPHARSSSGTGSASPNRKT